MTLFSLKYCFLIMNRDIQKFYSKLHQLLITIIIMQISAHALQDGYVFIIVLNCLLITLLLGIFATIHASILLIFAAEYL